VKAGITLPLLSFVHQQNMIFMEKGKLFMVVGVMLLNTIGFVIVRANNMSDGLHVGYARLFANYTTITNLPSLHYTNVKGLLNTVIIATRLGTKLSTIYTSIACTGMNCTNKIYYKP
jgi:hypothetical protein